MFLHCKPKKPPKRVLNMKQKDMLKHYCWESKYHSLYEGQFSPVDVYLHGAAFDSTKPGLKLARGVDYEWRE